MALEERISSTLLKEHLLKLAQVGKRKDGRKFDEIRPIEIKEGTFTKGLGEAWVALGKTQVLTSLKFDVGEPYPDSPDKGVLISNVELLPLASPSFEPGPPDENAIEMARVVDRAFRGSDAIDLSKLVIQEGKLVYILFLDLYVLDYDGNLFDALTLSALIAFARAKIPVVEVGEDGSPRLVEGESFPLPLVDYPLSFSFVKIGDYLMIDPNLEEESVADAALTLAIDKDLNICSIQKRNGAFKLSEINKAVDIARVKYPEVMEQVRKVVDIA
ncbi:MAG TPA: exosome complex protein Rrp42 [Candidatus Korarchaeota archaeon]|nr:MAG: RNA-binding protein [Candidatus Korarchaeota archaeon]HDD68828.1 exosome complex protein Rrp42 [Candidatus Korarchaeota archaeon]